MTLGCVCTCVLVVTEEVAGGNGDGVMVVVTILVMEAQWQYLAAGRTECVHRNDDMIFISQPMQLWRKRDSQMLLDIQALSWATVDWLFSFGAFHVILERKKKYGRQLSPIKWE